MQNGLDIESWCIAIKLNTYIIIMCTEFISKCLKTFTICTKKRTVFLSFKNTVRIGKQL